MNQFTGDWCFNCGVPAKAGRNGVVMVVIPNVCGIAIHSPRTNQYGISERGIRFCEQLTRRYRMNIFDLLVYGDKEIRSGCDGAGAADQVGAVARWVGGGPGGERTQEEEGMGMGMSATETSELLFFQLCSAAGSGDAARVQTCLRKGAPVSRADYDRRTALHIACSDGHAEVVAALLKVPPCKYQWCACVMRALCTTYAYCGMCSAHCIRILCTHTQNKTQTEDVS
jgi:glutaminase